MLTTLTTFELADLSSLDIDGDVIPILAIGGGFVVAIVAICAGTLKAMVRVRAREASRREIAAYIAEGSITPDEGERLLNAGRPHWERWSR